MVIGVSGLYFAGKTHFVQNFLDYIDDLKTDSISVKRIDLDVLGHDALRQATAALRERFGDRIFDESGTVNRSALGNLVFSNPQKLVELENILHPIMKAECAKLLSNAQKPSRNLQLGRTITIIDAALLFKLELYHYCDKVIIVRTPTIIRLLRSCTQALKNDKVKKDKKNSGARESNRLFDTKFHRLMRAVKMFILISRIQRDLDSKKNRKILSALSDYVCISGMQSLIWQRQYFHTLLKE